MQVPKLTAAELKQLHLTAAQLAEYNSAVKSGSEAKLAAFYQAVLGGSAGTHHFQNWEQAILNWSSQIADSAAQQAAYMNAMTKMINEATTLLTDLMNFMQDPSKSLAKQIVDAANALHNLSKGESPDGTPLNLPKQELAQIGDFIKQFEQSMSALASAWSGIPVKVSQGVTGLDSIATMIGGIIKYGAPEVAIDGDADWLNEVATNAKAQGKLSGTQYTTGLGNFQQGWQGNSSIASSLNATTLTSLTNLQQKMASLQQTASAVVKMQNTLLVSVINRASSAG